MQNRAILFAMIVLSACKPEVRVDQAKVSDALPVLLVPPASYVVGRSGSEDALQITFRSEWDAERLVEYYRGSLKREPWELVSDAKDRDGATVLYAERDGSPLWVRLQKAAGAAGTLVEISGAVTGDAGPSAGSSAHDSAAADTSSGN